MMKYLLTPPQKKTVVRTVIVRNTQKIIHYSCILTVVKYYVLLVVKSQFMPFKNKTKSVLEDPL
jgi:hypothetical protein